MTDNIDDICSPTTLKRQLSVTADNRESKRVLLEKIRDDCSKNVKHFKKRYKKCKKRDRILEFSTTFCQSSSTALIIGSFELPPLIIIAVSLSGCGFVLSRFNDKLNYKQKFMQHNNTIQQYNDLCRQITIVLAKNNMTSEQYHNYISDICQQISLIEDSQIL